ncbi:hypothetical protein [Flavobacterium sp. TBRC 19031]|uniref:hypothetical protein n=1 Tax=Flavobacterium mekongense TaxID=3379707 RepID=UPI00399BED0D
MKAKNNRITLGIIAFLFFAFYFIRIYSEIFKIADSSEYLSTAEIIKNGSYFTPIDNFNTAEIATKRPLLYPLFLLISFTNNLKFIIFLQTLFGIFNFYLITKFLEKLEINVNNHIILTLLLTPSIFIYTQLIMSEWLAMTLVLLMTYLFLFEFNKKRFFIIQILTILLALTKPVFYPIIFFNLLYFAIYMYRKKVFSIFLFLPVTFLFGYLNFNEYKTGYKHFSSIENINLIDYNLYYYKSYKEGQEIADNWRENIYKKSSELKTFAEKNNFYKQTAINEIKLNFWGYSWYHFFTSIRGMIDPGRFDVMTFFKKEDGKQGFIEILNNNKTMASFLNQKNLWIIVILIPIFIMQLLKFFCFCTFVYQNKYHLFSFRFYPILILILYIFLTGPVNCSRLMMPLQGLMIIITLHQLNKFQRSFKKMKS